VLVAVLPRRATVTLGHDTSPRLLATITTILVRVQRRDLSRPIQCLTIVVIRNSLMRSTKGRSGRRGELVMGSGLRQSSFKSTLARGQKERQYLPSGD
jgi:hypothetical protein